MKLRDRIKDFRRVKASEILPNPQNWRTHPKAQQDALRGVLAEVGIADALLVREVAGGLQLIDGHLRADTAPDSEWPVLVLDVNDAEAAKLLASLDPLAAMAETDPVKLDELLREVQTGSEDLAKMLAALAKENGLIPAEPVAPKQLTIEPQFSVLIRCADEAEQRVVIEELDKHGLDTRALCMGWPEQPPVERPEDEKPLAVDELRIVRKTKIKQSPRLKQLAGIYDLPPKSASEHVWIVKIKLDRPWNVGLIVGPSGSGKTTIARELFGDKIVTGWEWPADASIIDGFPEAMSVGDIVNLLSSVGFSSPPHWLKPFHVLSNGEQFRVNLARTMAEMPELAVIDEFTSVVDRTVAQVGSCAVAKAVRASNRRLVAVSCHNDIEEWLQPDWKYEPATGAFSWRLLRRRPEIRLSIRRVDGKQVWPLFRGHHYLTGDLHRSAKCFMASINGQPAAFAAVLHQAGKTGGWWREHRTVCLPDFQGVGIGTALSNFVASLYAATAKKYRSTTSHPAMIAHRMRSSLWRLHRAPCLAQGESAGSGFEQLLESVSASRLTAGFEYIGPSRPDEARQFGVLKTAGPNRPVPYQLSPNPEPQTAPVDPTTELASQTESDSPTASTSDQRPRGRKPARAKSRKPKRQPVQPSLK